MAHRGLTCITTGGNDYTVHCRFCCQMGFVIGRERDREDDALLRNDLIDDDKFQLMLLTTPPLYPVLLSGLSVLSLWWNISALHRTCWSLANKVARCARSCTVGYFRSPIWTHAVAERMQYSRNKIPLRIYSPYTLSHCIALFHSASAYSIGVLFGDGVSRIIPESVSAVISSVAYV